MLDVVVPEHLRQALVVQDGEVAREKGLQKFSSSRGRSPTASSSKHGRLEAVGQLHTVLVFEDGGEIDLGGSVRHVNLSVSLPTLAASSVPSKLTRATACRSPRVATERNKEEGQLKLGSKRRRSAKLGQHGRLARGGTQPPVQGKPWRIRRDLPAAVLVDSVRLLLPSVTNSGRCAYSCCAYCSIPPACTTRPQTQTRVQSDRARTLLLDLAQLRRAPPGLPRRLVQVDDRLVHERSWTPQAAQHFPWPALPRRPPSRRDGPPCPPGEGRAVWRAERRGWSCAGSARRSPPTRRGSEIGARAPCAPARP